MFLGLKKTNTNTHIHTHTGYFNSFVFFNLRGQWWPEIFFFCEIWNIMFSFRLFVKDVLQNLCIIYLVVPEWRINKMKAMWETLKNLCFSFKETVLFIVFKGLFYKIGKL